MRNCLKKWHSDVIIVDGRGRGFCCVIIVGFGNWMVQILVCVVLWQRQED